MFHPLVEGDVMDRDDALKLLTGGPGGVHTWNDHREAGGEIPSLSGADLGGAHLGGAHLSRADLRGAHLSRADLGRADLGGADLIEADLSNANLSSARCGRTTFADVDLF